MTTIQEYWLKIKLYTEVGVREWGIAILVIFIAIFCFGLGRLSALYESRGGLSFAQAAVAAEAVSPMAPGGLLVASKTGETYYYPWCGGAVSIPEASKVWFKDEASAREAGYRAAKNCKGL